MSEYKNIIGKGVRFLSSNLDNNQAEGQIWYNSTDGVFKNIIANKAFSSGANLITARSDFRGTFGTQSAFKGAGGFTTTPSGNTPALTDVEDYDGTGFTSAAVLPLATRNQGGGGTQTAGWVAGGRRYPTSPANQTNKTQEWDGSSWSEGGALGSSKYGNSGTGTLTAGLVSGGFDNAAPGNLNQTEEYNGSTWSEQNNMGTARYRTAATGTQTATILFGGVTYPGSPQDVDNVEEYDGTSWTTLTSLPSDRGMGHAFGTTTNAIVTGGRTGPPGASNTTFQWDGTSYTSFPALSTARYNGGDGATTSSTAGIVTGGYTTTSLTVTEEYNQSGIITTGAAWASGGNLGTARNRVGGAGTQTAGLAFGGSVSPGGGEPTVSNLSEEYDGSSWTEGNNLGTSRYGVQGCGIQTAALGVGGVINPNSAPGATKDTEEYDGSSWTAQPDTSNIFYLDGVAGTQTAAVIRGGAGGPPGPLGNYTEEYNGSSWTTNPGTIGTARYAGSFIGTQTAAIYCGGQPPAPVGFLSDTYDGSSFTSAPSLVVQFARGGGAGTQTNALIFGPSTDSVITQQYNGTSWATSANNATERTAVAGSPAATASAALMSGGGPGVKNNTEEFTGETTALNVKTITTS